MRAPIPLKRTPWIFNFWLDDDDEDEEFDAGDDGDEDEEEVL